MKKVTLEQAHELLENTSAVIWGEESNLSYPLVNDLEGDEDNCFFELILDDEEMRFNEGDNQTVVLDGFSMVLVDEYGENQSITLLVPMDVEDPFVEKLNDEEE
jgi:hypothetical protein